MDLKNNKTLIYVAVLAGLSGILGIGYYSNGSYIRKCNAGNNDACVELAKVYGADYINANRITNPQYQVALNDIAEKEAAKSEAEEKRRKEREAYEARRDAEIAKAAAEREARGDWVYDTYTDDATGKKANTASLTSNNSMNFSSPYSGTQYGTFVVRNHPRFGVDAYLSIQQGQLLCNNYNNSNVLIRFDNGEASSYACNEAADYSNDIVFISDTARLESRMKSAKKMYLTVSVYNEGSRTWEFDVRGYDSSKV